MHIVGRRPSVISFKFECPVAYSQTVQDQEWHIEARIAGPLVVIDELGEEKHDNSRRPVDYVRVVLELETLAQRGQLGKSLRELTLVGVLNVVFPLHLIA